MFCIFLGTLPVKLLLEERKLMLVKSCVFFPGVLRFCGLLSMYEDDFIDVCYMYDVNCKLPKYVIKIILDHIFLMYYVTIGLYCVVLF